MVQVGRMAWQNPIILYLMRLLMTARLMFMPRTGFPNRLTARINLLLKGYTHAP